MKRLPVKKKQVIIIALLLVIAVVQFIQPSIEERPVTHPIQAPADVVAILQRACYNCHSNESRLSWYDKIAPVSWLVAADVQEARSRFNFSTFDTLGTAEQKGLLWEMVNMVINKKMPLSTYTALHPEAKLTDQDIAILKNYVTAISPSQYHDTALLRQAEKEYNAFLQQTTASTKGLQAANGVQYEPGFQSWQVISTTNRFDNHSIRVVYANAIAVKAIQENNVNPLPPGSTIVKAVWNAIEAENGDVTPGSLNSIQIMTKDNKRFPDSGGWGFAKFNGINLAPCGVTPAFNATCFNCHKAASETDMVFNLPLQNKELKQ